MSTIALAISVAYSVAYSAWCAINFALIALPARDPVGAFIAGIGLAVGLVCVAINVRAIRRNRKRATR